ELPGIGRQREVEACRDCVVFLSSRRRHTRCYRDWSSDVCSSDLLREERPDLPQTFEGFERALEALYAEYTPEFAAKESGVDAAKIGRASCRERVCISLVARSIRRRVRTR